MKFIYLSITFLLISFVSYSQFSIGLTGDTKTPIGFEVGIKRFNMIAMTAVLNLMDTRQLLMVTIQLIEEQ